MKKFTLSIVVALSAIFTEVYAQVGINTSLPAASLDIAAKNATGNSPNVDGVIIPRVDRLRAQSMTGVVTSTLVYVNDVATGAPSGTAVNIDSVGYYYFDGTSWVKLYNPNNTTYTVGNIYTTDGTVQTNRIVSQTNKTLAFTGTSNNAFSIDGSGFSVDAANHRVGIGTTTPAVKLDVVTATSNYGFSHNDGTVRIASYIGTGSLPGSGLSGWLGTQSNHPFDLIANNTFNVRITTNGKVGVGTVAPTGKLSVVGNGSGFTPMLTLTNTNVTGNPSLNIYPGYTSNGSTLVEGNQFGVVFDQDPGASTGANVSLYDFHGQIRSTASSTLSDRRLKKDIKDLNEYGLAEVIKLQPKRYTMKEYSTPDIGFIAQELKAVIPEVVYGDENTGLLSVDYSKISLVLVNAIKEQQKIIEEQNKQIKQLQVDVQALKEKK